MRIAFIYYDGPDYCGGPLINAKRLLPELVRCGHEVHGLVFYHGGCAPSVTAMEAANVRCSAQPFVRQTESMVRTILELLDQIKPDVFVPNISVAGWMAARWVRKSGIPTIAAYRSDDPFHHAMVEQFVLGNQRWAVSGLVCVSEYLQESVARHHPVRSELCTIPSGVPIPGSVACQDGSLKIVYVGRLVQEQKRIHETMASVLRVLRAYPDALATFIGSGPEKECLRNEVRRHRMQGRVNIKGVIPCEEIQQELLKHNVLVLLSDYEGTPGSVMDGMACGLVPVCLDIEGGIQELIEKDETGLLVCDRENAFDFAISRLHRDIDLRKRLACNARRHIEANYSIESAALRWDAFMRGLCERAENKRSISSPFLLTLPPVHRDLAREDRRERVRQRFKNMAVGGWRKMHASMPMSKQRAHFVDPPFHRAFLDLYGVRSSIFRELKAILPEIHGVVLDVGCGKMPYKDYLVCSCKSIEKYIGLDLERSGYGSQPDLIWDGNAIPLSDEAVDCALATELFEHCPDPEQIMKEIFRVLRKDGILFFTVPFLWPLHDVPHDEYRYTPYSLRRHLENAGFKEVEIVAMGGWDASLAQMMGLWVRRRPMKTWKRTLLSCVFSPIIRSLYRIDAMGGADFRRDMITGLAGVVRKS